MRFHVLALPHTHVTQAFSSCAYSMKVLNFCRMMKERGHDVLLYAGEQNEAPCTEHIVCISEEQRQAAVGQGHYVNASFNPNAPHWQVFNANAIREIGKRAEPRDFICIIGGYAQKPVADAFPSMMSVEFGIGYEGSFAKYRVFESYAWMHHRYGAEGIDDGRFMEDAVIPGYLDPDQFPFRGKHRRGNDYYLFIGRLIDRKGYAVAQLVCQRLKKRLVLAGPGEPKGYGEFVGVVGPEERGKLMAGATAVFVPTQYIEPFGNVAVEAMACGTPVISTDWGAMTETVVDGVTGFRCHSLAEFMHAAEAVKSLDHNAIRRHVLKNYSLAVIAKKYERYFERLSTLWGGGWYQDAA